MFDLDTSVDDIDINAMSCAVVIDVRVIQSELIRIRLDAFAVTDPLQTPRCVFPDSIEIDNLD